MMPPLVLLIKFVVLLLIFSSKLLFSSVGHQLVTFARILVAKYFFHLHGDQNGRSLERCPGVFWLDDIPAID